MIPFFNIAITAHHVTRANAAGAHGLVECQRDGGCTCIAILRQIGHHPLRRHAQPLCRRIQDTLVRLYASNLCSTSSPTYIKEPHCFRYLMQDKPVNIGRLHSCLLQSAFDHLHCTSIGTYCRTHNVHAIVLYNCLTLGTARTANLKTSAPFMKIFAKLPCADACPLLSGFMPSPLYSACVKC